MQTTAAPIRGAALAAMASGGIVAVIAALTDGRSAVWGALVGTAVAVGALGFGAASVAIVARLMPAASLLFALVTYTFQVLTLALVMIGLDRSGVLDDAVDRSWLGAAIIVVVLAWTVAHLRRAMTQRIPAFETPADTAEPASNGASHAPAEGGAR